MIALLIGYGIVAGLLLALAIALLRALAADATTCAIWLTGRGRCTCLADRRRL